MLDDQVRLALGLDRIVQTFFEGHKLVLLPGVQVEYQSSLVPILGACDKFQGQRNLMPLLIEKAAVADIGDGFIFGVGRRLTQCEGDTGGQQNPWESMAIESSLSHGTYLQKPEGYLTCPGIFGPVET